MIVPEHWLRSFCDPPLGAEALAHGLTMAGLEVEALRPLALGAVTLYVARKPTLRLASPG